MSSKSLCLQTLCWLHGERSLPIGLLVLYSLRPSKFGEEVLATFFSHQRISQRPREAIGPNVSNSF